MLQAGEDDAASGASAQEPLRVRRRTREDTASPPQHSDSSVVPTPSHVDLVAGPPTFGVTLVSGKTFMPTQCGDAYLTFSVEELRFAKVLDAAGLPDGAGGVDAAVRVAARSIRDPPQPLGALPEALRAVVADAPPSPEAELSISLDCAEGLRAAEAAQSDADSAPEDATQSNTSAGQQVDLSPRRRVPLAPVAAAPPEVPAARDAAADAAAAKAALRSASRRSFGRRRSIGPTLGAALDTIAEADESCAALGLLAGATSRRQRHVLRAGW